MKLLTVWLGFGLILFTSGSELAASDAKSASVSISGYVLDSACAFTKGISKPVSSECAVSCARNESPLVILTADGAIYWPISKEMPAASENKRLLPFAGKHVTASGELFERGGSKAIVIDKIAADE